MQLVYAVSEKQMKDWEEICKKFAEVEGAELLFVNETSCGIQRSDGQFQHIYIDEMEAYLKEKNNGI